MEERCCICFQDKVLESLKCKHKFCSECITKLDKCALCRVKLKSTIRNVSNNEGIDVVDIEMGESMEDYISRRISHLLTDRREIDSMIETISSLLQSNMGGGSSLIRNNMETISSLIQSNTDGGRSSSLQHNIDRGRFPLTEIVVMILTFLLMYLFTRFRR